VLYGQSVPGATCAAQLAAIQHRLAEGQRDRAQVRVVAYGTRTPAAIEGAAGARRSDDDWQQRLTAVLAWFRDCRWPLDYLHPDVSPGP
jgi:hypothetical protein